MATGSIGTLAIAALMVTAASVQAASPNQDGTAPAASTPAPVEPGSSTTAPAQAPATAPTQDPSTASTQAPATERSSAAIAPVTVQGSDQWLTSQVIGAAVYNQANEKVGSVNDLLLDSKGMPIAAVISTGGFLGIGGKKVTVEYKSLQFVRSGDSDKVIAPIDKEQLKVAEAFKPYSPPPAKAPVTADRSPAGPAPAGSPMKPRSP